MDDEMDRLLNGCDLSNISVLPFFACCRGNATEVFHKLKRSYAYLHTVRSLFPYGDTHHIFLKNAHVRAFQQLRFSINIKLDYLDDLDSLEHFFLVKRWEWWDARVNDANEVVIYIRLLRSNLDDFEDLRWLVSACGAYQLEKGSEVVFQPKVSHERLWEKKTVYETEVVTVSKSPYGSLGRELQSKNHDDLEKEFLKQLEAEKKYVPRW